MSATAARKTTREIERHYFERFRKAYALPAGSVTYGDKPDVTLTGERTIGIEITRFYLRPGSASHSEPRQPPLPLVPHHVDGLVKVPCRSLIVAGNCYA